MCQCFRLWPGLAVGVAFAAAVSSGVAQPTVPMGLPVREVRPPASQTPPSPSAARLTESREHYFGVYELTTGAKLGWYAAKQSPVLHLGKPAIRFSNISEFTFRQGRKQHTNSLTEEFIYARTSPYNLLQLQLTETKGNTLRKISLLAASSPETAGYLATIQEGQDTRKESILGLKHTAADYLAASVWACSGAAKAGQALRVTALDVRELTPYQEQFSFLGQPSPSGAQRLQCRNLKDGSLSEYEYDTRGHLLSANIGGVTALRREPKKLATAIPQPVDLFQQSLVPCDEPIGDFFQLQRIVLTLRGPAAADPLPENQRQRVLNKAPHEWQLVLGTEEGLPRVASLAEKEANLEPSAQLPLTYPPLTKLAAQATAGAMTTRDKVAKLVHFVKNYIEDDTTAEPIGVIQLLRQRRGDCTEHTLLFTALARCLGIPCREVTGYLYLGDAEQAFAGHAWNEVVLDGKWQEVDATWGLTTVTPAHILLSTGKATLKEMRFLTGGNTITINSVR